MTMTPATPVNTHNKKIIESVFEEFFLIVMKDHYLASFINSHQSMERLIQAQTHFLYRALFELKAEEVYEEYYRIGTIHWKIRLDEGYLFKMLDFIENQLAEKIRSGQIDLSFELMEEVFHKIRNSTGYAYIFGNLDDTLTDLKPESQEGRYQIEHLKSFRNHLLNIHNWGNLEIDDFSEDFVNDFTLSDLGIALSTIAFKIKSFSNRRQQLQIESLNQSVHKNAALAIKYYEMGNYVQTLLMVKHLVNDTTLLVTLLEQHNHNWQKNKNEILLRFLSEKSYQGGLFSITTNASDSHGAQLNAAFFKQIKERLKTELNSIRHIFAFDVDDTLYIYSESQVEDKFNLIESIQEISDAFITQHHILITDPLLNIGYIDTKYLQTLSAEEMKETIRILEYKTKHLTNLPNQAINSINFGQSIHVIVDEIKQNLDLKNLVIEAINNYDIQLHFHPIVHVGTNTLFGAESLVRIQQDDVSIPAGRFIDIINDYNLSLQLDLAVIQRISEDLTLISDKVNTLFININPESIQSEKATAALKCLISEAAEHNLNIVLELTEYSLTSELDSLKQLQAPNFGVAVDDFGTGYTNFEIVKKLKDEGLIQILKVDGSLVKTIVESETSQSLLETIILLGTKLGLDLVLEYIEDQSIVDKLQLINNDLHADGIVFGQGWYYSKPEPIESFKKIPALAQKAS